jgi:hypothetical protein
MRLRAIPLAVAMRAMAVLAGAALLTHALTEGAEMAPPGAPREAASPDAAALPQRATLGSLDQWAAIVQQPLFHPGRRPWQAAAAAAPSPTAPAPAASAPAPAPPSGWMLVGTVMAPTGAVAVLRSPASDRPRLLRAGDTLDGWKVIAIAHDRLAFNRDGRSWSIVLGKAQ